MTLQEKVDYLREQFTYYAVCPCCDQHEVCTEECSFEEDCPGQYAILQSDRYVLEKTK